jgi:hypothetical protein
MSSSSWQQSPFFKGYDVHIPMLQKMLPFLSAEERVVEVSWVRPCSNDIKLPLEGQ